MRQLRFGESAAMALATMVTSLFMRQRRNRGAGMSYPKYVMAAIILWNALTELKRMTKLDKTSTDVAASFIAVFLRAATVTCVLAWGGFWNA